MSVICQSKKVGEGRAFYRWVIILVLLGGVFLRWASLSPLSAMLHCDEAWHGIDALAMMRAPHYTPFLPNNFGRESGWVYWLIPYLAILGATPFALRFAVTILGILTLATTYRLGRELLGRAGAFWGMAALAGLYWHVHISQQALRANLFIFMGTLAATLLLFAHRKNTWRAWFVAGVALGALAHTYFASVGWLALAGGLLLGLGIVDRDRRKGSALALALAGALWMPLIIYFITYSDMILARPTTVSALSLRGVLLNLRLWGDAWLVRGDMNHEFNLVGRPILDGTLGLCFGVGLVALLIGPQKKWRGLLLLAWGGGAWLPSLLSNQAPHFLRASGMAVPVALVAGMGCALMVQGARKYISFGGAVVLPALLLVLTAGQTFKDFHQTWVSHPDTFIVMEQHVNRGIDYVREHTEANVYVYFTPFTPAHPVISFRAADLAPRPIGAFDSHQCLVLPDTEAVYVSLTMYEGSFAQRLAQWAEVRPLYEDNAGTGPRYSIWTAQSRFPAPVMTVHFAERFAVDFLQALPEKIAPGMELRVALGIRPLVIPDTLPSLFVHLYGDPTPYAGGTLWAQADSQVCASYPAHLWRLEETIVQEFVLTFPDALPPGDYEIAIGMYPFPEGPRLPITTAEGSEYQYVVLQSLHY